MNAHRRGWSNAAIVRQAVHPKLWRSAPAIANISQVLLAPLFLEESYARGELERQTRKGDVLYYRRAQKRK